MFRDRLNPLDVYDDLSLFHSTELQGIFSFSFKIQFQLSSFDQQFDQMFLATGSFQTVVASSHGISQPSVFRCICTIPDALCFYAKEFIVFPNELEQLINQPRFSERYLKV